jgi:hypothetical protein
MANFFDQFDGPSPYAPAISSIESGGKYDVLGPTTKTGDRAFGKYQVMGANVGPWTEEVLGKRMHPRDFLASPEAQDAVFNAKFGKYVEKYGPEGAAKAWFAGEKGMNNPNARDILGTTVSSYAEKFNRALPQGAQPASGQAPQAMAQPAKTNFFDQFDAPSGGPTKITVNPIADRFVDTPAPQNADALQSGLQRQARDLTTGPATSPGHRMAIEHGNLLSAASQGTTPNIGAQSGNLLSTEVFEGDDGSILYRDPQTGQVVPTDKAKHVVIRDPADNTPKVYARSDSTNEMGITGAARTLAPGFLTGAPTQAMNVARRTATVPSVDQLKGAATAGYQSADVVGLTMAPQELATIVDRVKTELTKRGLSSPTAKTTWELLDQAIASPGPGAMQTGQNIQSLRASLSLAAKTPGTSDGAAAMTAKRIIDDLLPAASALEGDAAKVAEILKTADQNYSAAKDAGMLADKTYRAELRASSANSGMNTGNTIKQRLTDILTTPKLRRGLTKEQIELAERIVRGNKTENVLRLVGNALGGGGGGAALASSAVGGTAAAVSTGDPSAFLYGALLPAGGLTMRAIGNKITLKQADKLATLLRSDSPLGRQMANPVKEWETAVRAFDQAKNARTFATLNIASRNLANNLRDGGVVIAAKDLLRAAQSPVKAAAEDEQPAVPRIPGQ